MWKLITAILSPSIPKANLLSMDFRYWKSHQSIKGLSAHYVMHLTGMASTLIAKVLLNSYGGLLFTREREFQKWYKLVLCNR